MIASFCLIWASRYSRLLDESKSVIDSVSEEGESGRDIIEKDANERGWDAYHRRLYSLPHDNEADTHFGALRGFLPATIH